MRYLGGKARTSKYIAAYLNTIRKPNQVYVEPFVGAGWVISKINKYEAGLQFASDANSDLIALWEALQLGWIPPESVSEDEYKIARDDSSTPAYLRAFVGFGCSFAGKWFGGYARSGDRNYAANAKRSVLKLLEHLQYPSVIFAHRDYRELSYTNALIYCDPPYQNTTGYGALNVFDSEQFWDTMQDWSKQNVVVVSEYTAPDSFISVLEIPTRLDMRNHKGEQEARMEKLFVHRSLFEAEEEDS